MGGWNFRKKPRAKEWWPKILKNGKTKLQKKNLEMVTEIQKKKILQKKKWELNKQKKIQKFPKNEMTDVIQVKILHQKKKSRANKSYIRKY